MLKRLKGLKHVTPGEWQAGPPRRSDGCGLGVVFLPARLGAPQSFCRVLRVLGVLSVLKALGVLRV